MVGCVIFRTDGFVYHYIAPLRYVPYILHEDGVG